MNLQHPEFLWGLALNIFPILIHLFNLQKHKTLYFSDVSLLKKIDKSTKKRSQLKNILVLVSRIMIISSVVLALCFPYKESNNTIPKKKTIGIYIDNSFSMDRKGIKSSSLLDQAKEDAYNIISACDENTNFFLLCNSNNFGSSNKLTKDQIIDLISKIEISKDFLSYDNLVLRQKEQIKSHKENVDLYWFTDLQKSSTISNQNYLDSFFNVNVINYEGLNNNNLSIDSIWFDDKNRKLNQLENLNISITNNYSTKYDFKITLIVNENEVKNQKVFTIEANEKQKFQINFIVKKHGLKSCKLKLEDYPSPDHLFDDEYFFTYFIKKEFKILHAYNNKENSFDKLKPLFETLDNPFFKSININNDLISNYTDFDMLILDGINEINDEINSEILNFLTNKKTVVISPSVNELNSNSFNESLNYLNIKINGTDSNKYYPNQIRNNNPFFKNVFEKTNANVKLPYFKNHYKINKNASHSQLISFENDDPLLISKKYNEGILYFFTANISLQNSNLTKHSLFVPLFLRIFEESNDFQILSYDCNNMSLVKSNVKNNNIENSIISCNNNIEVNFNPSFQKINSENYYEISNNKLIAGNYTILNNSDTIDGFSLNYNRNESKMNFYSTDEFNQELFNANLENHFKIYNDNNDRISNLIKTKISGEFYWKYFIILALLFIVLEILFIRLIHK
ncbi:MAG: hypothetical protein CL846_05540 [Crocinitomicaceae bacterium]|nr:hypothetical protein [Crocinitomicaceae bacterium]|tara:strand:+ start:233 stop:2284 length:2052 start_codon:yes stop_codon:yes gene_type:complete